MTSGDAACATSWICITLWWVGDRIVNAIRSLKIDTVNVIDKRNNEAK